MKIIKRDGSKVDFELEKIKTAIYKSFRSVDSTITEEKLDYIAQKIVKTIEEKIPADHTVTVEEVQDLVELNLIDENYYREVKSYILYRAKHNMDRKVITDFNKFVADKSLMEIVSKVQREFDSQRYPIESLYFKFESFIKPEMNDKEILDALIRAASELTSKEAPDWEIIAARFLSYKINSEIKEEEDRYEIYDLKSKIKFLTDKKLYGVYIF